MRRTGKTAKALLAAVLFGSGQGIWATGPAAAAEIDGPAVEWIVSLWGSPRPFTAGIETLSKRVAEMTDGKFEIELRYGEALASAGENLPGIASGSFDAAIFCVTYSPDATPALTALDLPFLPNTTLDQTIAVHEAYFKRPVVQEEFAKWNAVPLFTALLPRFEIMGRGEPPLTTEDYEGMRLHAAGQGGEPFRRLGASVSFRPGPEMYEAFERGVVDAELNPFTFAFFAYRLNELAEWYTNNLSMNPIACPFVANSTSYDDLPQQYRSMLEELKEEAYQAMKEGIRKQDRENLMWLKENNVQAIHYSKEERDKFIEIGAKPVWDEWVATQSARGLPAQALLDSIFAASGTSAE